MTLNTVQVAGLRMRGFPVSRTGMEKRPTKLVTSVITRAGYPARYLWPQLLARIYGVFALKCSGCGGRMRLVGFITEPPTVRQILEHVGEPTTAPAIAQLAHCRWR